MHNHFKCLFWNIYRMAITKIENKNHTDDRKYSVGFNKKYSPVFYVLYDPIQEDGKPIPTNKLSYPRK